MNRQLAKKITSLEQQKDKKIRQREQIEEEISLIEDQLKPLYDYRKSEEKIEKMKQDLEERINLIL